MPTKKKKRQIKASRVKQGLSKSAKAINISSKVKSQAKTKAVSKNPWAESYSGIFLLVVIIIAGSLLFSLLKNKNSIKVVPGQALPGASTQKQSSYNHKTQLSQSQLLPKTYEVKKGDYLWSIAQKLYGSGYNWVDIARANHLQNPGVLYKGQKLVIPNVKPIVIARNNTALVSKTLLPGTDNSPITGNSYKVAKGDYLWAIAVRAYGNGYKWIEIAKANYLASPSMIFSGNVLTIPR